MTGHRNERARDFMTAAARLASQAALLVQDGRAPGAFALAAVEEAVRAARELEGAERAGAAVDGAYEAATRALDAAALAIAATRHEPAPFRDVGAAC